jgi:hypothetical protein
MESLSVFALRPNAASIRSFLHGLLWGFCFWWAYAAWGILMLLTGAWRDLHRLVPRPRSNPWFWWGAGIGLAATIVLCFTVLFPAATAPIGVS